MEKVTQEDGQSADVVGNNIEKLQGLFPDAFEDGRVNFEVLRQLLGDASVLEEGEEKYGLNWHGKKKARQIALTPSPGTLLPCAEESTDWEDTKNIFIEGDNLESLKLLQRSYAGKVKLIYIDPPYNTGSDFVYPDNYADNLDTYLKYTGQVDDDGMKFSSNTETGGRKHTNWLNMMLPRLKVAKNLLSRDGAIFISIDQNEQPQLQALCDEVFGSENLISCITVINNMKGRNDKKNIATAHEYLLAYGMPDFESLGVPLTDEQLKEYKHEDDNGEKYALRDLRKRGRPDRREDRPNMYFPIFFDEAKQTCSLERRLATDIEITPKRGDKSDGRWRWGFETVKENLDILHAKYSAKKDRWDIEHRVYLNPGVRAEVSDEEDDDDDNVQRTSKPKSFWWGGEISTDVANREFKKQFPGSNPDYPKSPYLLEKIVHMATRPGDLVLDFFAGYGTMGDTIYRLAGAGQGRRFILIQLPEEIDPDDKDQAATRKYCADNGIAPRISELAKERLRRSASVVREQSETDDGDFGFRVFKLANSNLLAWNPDKSDLEGTLDIHAARLIDGRDDGDLLYELLLKRGVDLATPIETKKFDGKEVHSIGFGVLFACLAKSIEKAEVDRIAQGILDWHKELEPETDTHVFFRDSAFEDDIAKTNMAAILEQNGITHVRSL
ncbi:site-specific DNA-methyltransferase [Erythrobacter sp. HKB08]|uniref:site-specific DNA-methyltransferase n=1 Tax=Erythrobacter sp. HKB08 TaxID=2502843 RepID=UPI001008C25A|nr:site-specific DNA-methyltransferase [Erythrobacter sp. HKB08]